jgi:hypothetical protein
MSKENFYMTVEPNGQARGEAGGARLNFILIIAAIALLGYSAYNYAPVAYNAFLFKDFMQETVNKAAYPPGQTDDWVTQQLRDKGKELDLPPEMSVNIQRDGGHISARVQWTRPVKLPGYVYDYKFDHTARSSGFINQQ